jgi:hypothetical protein
MTARKAAEIAEACREYLAAHGRRAPSAARGTIREDAALFHLSYVIAAPEREEVSAASGTVG